MSTLENKTVVVIGGSSGIGFAVALASLQSFASPVIIASSSEERVKKAVERLKAHNLPGVIRGEVVDATNSASIKDLIGRLGEVDHIVWTSGNKVNAHFPDFEPEMGRAAFDVRFWGPFTVAQTAKIRPGGSLVLTMGPSLIRPQPTMSVWASVTGALDGLIRGLAVDLAPIRVNAVSPGGVDTEFFDDLPSNTKDVLLKNYSDKLLIKRFGQPEEIAMAYIFLMKCGYITGQRIDVDGGIALA
ncbi:short-chain dehydrogenase/reductase SDR [Pholiota conissans]|uniref:Short-chain dehydrogenase/reductase SDR n=1 Tax=Pholiota conissans TaxID=109636 RepID=A0A9P5Z8C6_9AGAR|nr:short-chain dehydrogenase/reductase SDR [Pholiota conissans]